MDAPVQPPQRWHLFASHALTVLALALGGPSPFQALRAEVVELRAAGAAPTQAEAEGRLPAPARVSPPPAPGSRHANAAPQPAAPDGGAGGELPRLRLHGGRGRVPPDHGPLPPHPRPALPDLPRSARRAREPRL